MSEIVLYFVKNFIKIICVKFDNRLNSIMTKTNNRRTSQDGRTIAIFTEVNSI
jgi:hypothetical protein